MGKSGLCESQQPCGDVNRQDADWPMRHVPLQTRDLLFSHRALEKQAKSNPNQKQKVEMKEVFSQSR